MKQKTTFSLIYNRILNHCFYQIIKNRVPFLGNSIFYYIYFMDKTCIKCDETKDEILFVKNTNRCKDCIKEYKKQHRLNNKEKLKEKAKEYYINNKEKILKRVALNYENNKDNKLEYQREYYENNKDYISEYKKEYFNKNKEKIRLYKNEYQNKRRKNDPIFKLKYSISRTIRRSLKCKGISKNKKTIEILGCDVEFFKIYIESMFSEKMCWSNYGVVWDIDHIIPLSSAKNEEDVYRLNHYTNLQPLDSYVNRVIKKDNLNFKN